MSNGTYDRGREDQYREMLQALAALEAKYKGVRGELLAKVRAELTRTRPAPRTLSVVGAPPQASTGALLPSCRVCGRQMRRTGTDGSLVCQNGHTRLT